MSGTQRLASVGGTYVAQYAPASQAQNYPLPHMIPVVQTPNSPSLMSRLFHWARQMEESTKEAHLTLFRLS
jgi:hypothetical protein